MNAVYNVASVEETWAVARQFAAEPKPGDVVCLEGDLGAGKTTFAQGLAAAYLDVFKNEPLTADSPLAADLPGLVRLPHMAAFAPEYLPFFFQELADGGWLK